MAFNPKLVSLPCVEYGAGMSDLEYCVYVGDVIAIHGMGDLISNVVWHDAKTEAKTTLVVGNVYFYIPTTTTGLFYLTFDITGVGSFRTINYRVLPKIAEPKNLVWIEAVDTTYYPYSTPISVLFDAPTRYFSQENKVVKYDDERGTIIPLRQDVFDTFTFESAPMNGEIARLLQTISEWDKVAVYFKEKGVWQSVKCVKSAEAFSASRFQNTFGCKVSGKFVVKS